MVLGALWLLAGVLAARQAAAVLRLPPDERLTDLETWIGEHGVLHVRGSLYDGDAFTGTPFSGLVLKPLTRAAEQSLGVAWTFGTLLLVVVLGLVAARALPGPVSRRTSLLAAPLGICLLVLSLPVRSTFTLGQTSVIPVLLVVLTVMPRTSGRQAGVLIGVAAALQPALLLFAVVMWLVGRRRAAALAGATFAACTALAWAAMPQDSWTYWAHHIGGAGLGAPADSLANQSLHGLLLRIGLAGPAELGLLALLAVTVVVVGLRRAVRYAQDGQLLLAAAITGCVALAVSPTSWQYQQLWILLAVVGRVGKRASDRLVWPMLVVLVMSLNRTALLPDIEVLGHIGYNAPLLAALAAACVVPFLSRASPVWDSPVPTPVVEPAKSRFSWVPLLRFLRRPLSRPNLMLELMLIRVGYFAYSWIRGHAPDERGVAEGHGDQVLTLEGWLHIDIEHWFNGIVADTSWLAHSMNWYYSTFHFLIPLSLLGWLYLRRPATYRWARTPLAFATLLALVGFWLYPLAPPRLMGLGYVDTAHGPQDLRNPDFGALTKLSNQYAAMPSLHVGWSLWCGVVIAIVAPYVWAKVLGALYPLLTTAVIVGTANHYLLDAIGGAVIVSAGFGLQYLLLGVGTCPHEEAPPLSATMGAAVARARGLVPGLVRQRGGRHDDAEPVEEPQSAADGPPKGGSPRVERHDQRV
ncbi:phosphatase PAP2 family protein [Streptomyces sp. NA02950]|uniref:bifunctional glycosyltransferase 87/phosphatase PAP2 family protein n=1 Tax=Streptomyces sp. NA02950 TaxID=2742137 RepID=UPI00159046E1|nr:bifunctional glycosyltransferase 87/phosphatase PAP2 family protein [Streptomyces sp. NA02950]QKV95215.1 phosphatase PAP2 family protein [Streptomyces sp. NA02950]